MDSRIDGIVFKALGLCLLLAIPAWGQTSPGSGVPKTESPATRTETIEPVAKQPQTTESPPRGNLILVVGVPGEPRYERTFSKIAAQWKSICEQANLELSSIGVPLDAASKMEKKTDRELLLEALRETASADRPLWVILVGHGTYDGRKAKFNLRGKDITASEFKATLAARTHPTLFVNCASASAPFMNAMKGENRIVITATKSGSQYNATVFGQYFADAAANEANDLDKDGGLSLLEVFLAASHATRDFYQSQKRIATENSLLDDNGDGKGTPANWFSGVRCVKKPKGANRVDGTLANQFFLRISDRQDELSPENRKRRAELEMQLEDIVSRRAQMTEDDFLSSIEPILLDLARLHKN